MLGLQSPLPMYAQLHRGRPQQLTVTVPWSAAPQLASSAASPESESPGVHNPSSWEGEVVCIFLFKNYSILSELHFPPKSQTNQLSLRKNNPTLCQPGLSAVVT